MDITTLGIDLAKSVFQLHGVDAQGVIVLQKKLRRGAVVKFLSKLEPCLIGIEACATSHYWAREIAALGHDVKMIPPAYVKPYVKRQKNDAADAEAICEAVTRPNMRFVPVKTEEQQAVLVLHRSRDLLMRQRTMILNAIRSHCAPGGRLQEFNYFAHLHPFPNLSRKSKHGIAEAPISDDLRNRSSRQGHVMPN